MTSPTTSQTTNRIHVSPGSTGMRYTQNAMPISGKTGLNGTRNGRGMSGRVRRSTMTPMFTSTKANSVPMLTSLTS